jgi:oxygen-dependent protoporphyrinogen oxidase
MTLAADDPAHAKRPVAAIVGAGIAGLTAAYRLRQAGWDVKVFEKEASAGGRVETLVRQGYRVDTGATAIAARYPLFIALARELGLELVWTSPYLGVYRNGRIHLLQLDRLVRSALSTDLLSAATKLRLIAIALDIAWAKFRGTLSYDDLRNAAPLDTESARDYMRRIAGVEADAYLGEPITRALLLANSDQVSRVELMSGLVNAVAGRLSTLAGGQAAIIDALVARVGALNLSTPITKVVETGSGVTLSCIGPDGNTMDEQFDACVVACPLPAAMAICPDHQRRLGALSERLRFTKGINVAVGTTRAADTPAFLVQLPSEVDAEIAMIIVENNKAPDRAPAGHGLLSVSWEMSASADWFDRSDELIVERSLATVFKLFPELRGTVDFTYVRRWPLALPHTRPGVYRAIGDFTAGLDRGARTQFAGDYLSQTGQNTAVAWANRAAANLIEIGHQSRRRAS